MGTPEDPVWLGSPEVLEEEDHREDLESWDSLEALVSPDSRVEMEVAVVRESLEKPVDQGHPGTRATLEVLERMVDQGMEDLQGHQDHLDHPGSQESPDVKDPRGHREETAKMPSTVRAHAAPFSSRNNLHPFHIFSFYSHPSNSFTPIINPNTTLCFNFNTP